MEMHQLFHNNIRSRPSVENISDDMQVINGKVLDQMAECDDKIIRHLDINNRIDNLTVIDLLIVIVVIHVEKFIDDVGKFLRHLLSHLGTGIFGRYLLANLNQTIDCNLLPILCIPILLTQFADHPFRIIDQICQMNLIFL